jgi:hypothetical protein
MMTETKTTVRELIEKLKEFDGDMRVVVSGYESGYEDCKVVKQIKIDLDACSSWYEGTHQPSDNGIDALLIDYNPNK